MKPIFSDSVPVIDRFNLGGPLVVRMFRENSMGPKDGGQYLYQKQIYIYIFSPFPTIVFIGDSLGGDLYWAAGLSYISDLPLKPHLPVKLHAFLNAGKLDTTNSSNFFPCHHYNAS